MTFPLSVYIYIYICIYCKLYYYYIKYDNNLITYPLSSNSVQICPPWEQVVSVVVREKEHIIFSTILNNYLIFTMQYSWFDVNVLQIVCQ